MTPRPAVLITGGAKRVGAAMARHLAAHGYDIALHYHHSEKEAKALQKELKAAGAECYLFRQDISRVADLEPMVQAVHAALPHCTALINNASVFERAGFMETDVALFDRQFDVNFKSAFFLTQAYAIHFGRGSVINILDTDIVGAQGSHFAYLLSKKALAEFTVMAARSLGPKIRVNGVCPGCPLPANEDDARYVEKLKAVIPLQSHPEPAEIAETAHWLMAQKHITGQLIYVDGGKHVL